MVYDEGADDCLVTNRGVKGVTDHKQLELGM
jgi:hypothetical protein